MHLPCYNCVLCQDSTEESLAHLLLECPFAQQCWGQINIVIDLQADPFQMLQIFKDQLGVPFFMEIVILMSGAIWKSRNDLIFNQVQPSVQQTFLCFKDECKLLLLRAKRAYSPLIDLWIANLS